MLPFGRGRPSATRRHLATLLRPFSAVAIAFLALCGLASCGRDLRSQDPLRQPIRINEVVVANGTILLPCTLIEVPTRGDSVIVVILPGSGRIDRDGNEDGATKPGPSTYRLLAEGLAEYGVSSLRCDKRGVGVNRDAPRTLELYVGDAIAMARRAKAVPGLPRVILLGHSEGSDIAILASQEIDLYRLFLVAGSGRPLATVAREQVEKQVDRETLSAFDRAIAEVRSGRAPSDVPTVLAPFFRTPDALLRNQLDFDPAAELANVSTSVTIFQGENDAQVSVDRDAKRLSKALPSARLVVLPNTNHLLKEEASPNLPQRSYTAGPLPLAPGVMDAILSAIKG